MGRVRPDPVQLIARRIVEAFQPRPLPEGDPFVSHSSEVDARTLERLARHGSWIDLPHEVVCANPLALAFMTPAAFVWFLPAYLVASVTHHATNRVLTSSVITCLTPPDAADAQQFETLVEDIRARYPDLLLDEPRPVSLGADDELLAHFMEQVAGLTLVEAAAVRDYLAYIDAEHGAEFPAFGPKQALERYWAQDH